ncbi:universal stress protein [Halorubellus sp. JP-L1]|uniref:universal stress protein n=1 Tax=Halorubellus sp. JP-L1 TaxID=2715753 RepID=UPI00140B7858|nr:universal stress protein [Halorubellus sp. JP-L1]NHN43058.1 universal stress protein [Halorubellus sp. JP-L1]
MYDTIVVPTDGSEYARLAASHASEVAVAFDATVHVVSVVDEEAASSVFERGGLDDERREELRSKATAAIADAEDVLADVDRVETAVVDGRTMESILGYVDEVDADLVAMGTHGRTGVDRYVAGSVTERVLRRIDVPVLTVREGESARALAEYDDVVVPTDGSDAANAAVGHALAFATVGDATVHAVNVVDVGSLAASAETTPPADLLERFEIAGEEATEAVAERASDAGLNAETAILKGSPGHELLEYASEHDADLLAMGTTGRTGLDRYLLGSTTERVVRHADRPVLAVNARNGDRD